MTTRTTTEIVRRHLKASKALRRSVRGEPQKARHFLIKAGILNKSGTALSKRYR